MLTNTRRARILFTIGYQGTTQGVLLDRLVNAGVQLLVDVRAVPQSRKPGFSKTLLAASLGERGIAYRHLRALGTPKPGRVAARAGRGDEMARIFNTHMQTEAARDSLIEATTLARGKPVCLLCFERDPHLCHRHIVAEMIASETGQTIEHLRID